MLGDQDKVYEPSPCQSAFVYKSKILLPTHLICRIEPHSPPGILTINIRYRFEVKFDI